MLDYANKIGAEEDSIGLEFRLPDPASRPCTRPSSKSKRDFALRSPVRDRKALIKTASPSPTVDPYTLI